MKPREEWLEIKDATPALISEELFNQVQLKLKGNKELSKRNSKRAEANIREVKESYDRLTDNADEVIFRVEAEGGHVIYANPSAQRLFGYSQAEWLADSALGFKMIHPDFAEKQQQIIEGINATKNQLKTPSLTG